jgi:hypothetical protein
MMLESSEEGLLSPQPDQQTAEESEHNNNTF